MVGREADKKVGERRTNVVLRQGPYLLQPSDPGDKLVPAPHIRHLDADRRRAAPPHHQDFVPGHLNEGIRPVHLGREALVRLPAGGGRGGGGGSGGPPLGEALPPAAAVQDVAEAAVQDDLPSRAVAQAVLLDVPVQAGANLGTGQVPRPPPLLALGSRGRDQIGGEGEGVGVAPGHQVERNGCDLPPRCLCLPPTPRGAPSPPPPPLPPGVPEGDVAPIDPGQDLPVPHQDDP